MADRNGYIGRAPSDSAVTVARQTFSPTGVTTDFTFESGYTVGYLDLFLNGTKLIEGVDYTATDTSTISLISAAINGDVLEGVAYKAFNLGDVNRIGIQSAGTLVGNVNTLNFVGAGNSILLNGGTIDVSISGGGSAGAGGTWSNYDGVTGVTTTKKVKIQNDLEVTGVSTFAAVNATTGSFSGNVSVGGTLTYEDVINVDSVGIITARSDISIADKIIHTGNTNTAIRFPAADTFSIETAGTEALRVDSSGRLLVGVTTTAFVNDVNFQITDNTNAKFLLRNPSYGTFSLAVTNDSVLAIKDEANTAERLRIDSSGRLLLGTTTEGFNNADNFTVSDSGNCGITIRSGATSLGAVAFSDATSGTGEYDGYLQYDQNTQSLRFGTASAERVRIAAAGQIGLGGANYGTSGQVILSNGSGSAPTWGDVPAAGLTTEAATPNNAVATLNLTAAQDHKVTASGITTITCSGGTEAESHTVRIINSGITTVGFSTYFLFPSGSTPSLPTASGAISLISFTVNRVGAGGTQLLAGASLNFS